MTLRELEYLVALAKYRHFGRAAEACLVSQPTLSAQIKKLEAELGTPLVERDSRSVMLTTFGKDAAERAKRILVDVQQLKNAALLNQNQELGTLRLGAFPTLGPYFLPHVVPQVHERFPQLEILLSEEKSGVLLSRLRSGELDAALLAMPVESDQLQVEFLFEEPFLLAVPKKHPLVGRASICMEDLSRYDLMLLEEGHCLREHALDVCRLSGAGQKSSFQATSLETLRLMVGANVGITLLPALATIGPIMSSDQIRLLKFSDGNSKRRIGLCWRRSAPTGPLLKQLAEMFRTTAQQLLHDRPHAQGPVKA
ncbi:LysR substrate-binding domain-containing protein [Rhizobium rhizogenes]|uniref:LysR substrate-binding domain-containing protein n=1 Tax=Rhizobium rhizogenes TaxID=359 RepID=UPI000648A2FF|nr:LysR substrate-binding domain-containing protein [Rhizobium rhizogenes]